MEEINLNNDLTPLQIVKELDKYIIGQTNAKKAVAIALRNRIRRKKLSPEPMNSLDLIEKHRTSSLF